MSARPGEPAPGRWSADRRLAAAGPIQTAAVGLRRIANRPVLEPERPDGVDPSGRPGTGRAGGDVGGVLHLAAQVEETTGLTVEFIEGHGAARTPPRDWKRSVGDQLAVSPGTFGQEVPVEDRQRDTDRDGTVGDV